MKYLLNISANLSSPPFLGAHRGEGRWEKNVLSALLQENKQVHTTRKIWENSNPRPYNLWHGTNEEWIKESVLLVHSAGMSLYVEREDVKAFVLHFYETPFGDAKEHFLRLLKEKRAIATASHYNPFIFNKLTESFGVENVYQLSGSLVPDVDMNADNFRKPYITWTNRNFISHLKSDPGGMEQLLAYLDSKITQEPELRIKLIVSIWDSDLLNPTHDMMRDYVLSFPSFQKFKHLYKNIDIYAGLDWIDLLNILKNTRYIISPAEPASACPNEAAMYGIPSIVNNNVNPFMTLDGGTLFPEVIKSVPGISLDFLLKLDKLHNDHDYYSTSGNAYRNYVKNNTTFKAYTQKLNNIILERGWFE